MRKDPKIMLQDILYSINKIHDYIAGLTFKEFEEDISKQDAVIRRLSIIGEAANKMPKDILDKYSDVEWKKVIGMRNFLVHEYFEIEMHVVWDTIEKDLPKLKADVTKILKELD